MRHSLCHISSFRCHRVSIKEKYHKTCYKPMIPKFPSTTTVTFNTNKSFKSSSYEEVKLRNKSFYECYEYISWGSNK